MFNLMLFTKSGDSMGFYLCIYVGVCPACVFARTGNILNSAFICIKFKKIKLYCTKLIMVLLW